MYETTQLFNTGPVPVVSHPRLPRQPGPLQHPGRLPRLGQHGRRAHRPDRIRDCLYLTISVVAAQEPVREFSLPAAGFLDARLWACRCSKAPEVVLRLEGHQERWGAQEGDWRRGKAWPPKMPPRQIYWTAGGFASGPEASAISATGRGGRAFRKLLVWRLRSLFRTKLLIDQLLYDRVVCLLLRVKSVGAARRDLSRIG
jgi:hypothetical protein